ncbi:hypothetical protein B0H17DRAFT_1097978 [Mycena rosella]|uniref:Uncharacterized protein n=1 Tax=Mycena rosella TaxID=1033263 RepID=A0AAD7CS79_MYCRO|nr:hypothetical protein B0H17DRAFT_1097978 [Mycena rosella]
MWSLKISMLSATTTRILTRIPLAPACASPPTPPRGRLFEPDFFARLRWRPVCASSSHRGNHPPRSSATLISTHTADEDGLWRG